MDTPWCYSPLISDATPWLTTTSRSEASHNPAKRVKTSSTNTSIPVSPTQAPHASGYISASPYTNPYQTQYANNPTAFSYPQHGYVPHQQQLPQPIHQQLQPPLQIAQQADLTNTNTHKRRTSDIEDAPLSANSGMSTYPMHQMPQPQGLMSGQPASSTGFLAPGQPASRTDSIVGPSGADATRNMVKKGRTNTPWTPVEERRLKAMREAGNNWNEIAKTFPNRTEGSVKKHWYKVRLPHLARISSNSRTDARVGHALRRVR